MSDSNFKEFLLDTIPTDDDKKIKGSKLSAEHQVLVCCFGYRQCLITISKRDASKKTVDCVIPCFSKTSCTYSSQTKKAEAVKKLLARFENLWKINTLQEIQENQKKELMNFN